MKRNIGPIFLLVLGLSFFGGFAWLTQNPDSPWLEKAQDWPVVGGLATRFREAYLGPPPAAEEATEQASTETPPLQVIVIKDGKAKELTEPLTLPPRPRVEKPEKPRVRPPGPVKVPPPSRPPPSRPPTPAVREPAMRYVAQEWVWFLPGNRILDAAAPDAEPRATLEAMAYLPILGRKGQWAEVVYQDRRGWIDTTWEIPHPKKGARRGILRHRYEPVQSSDVSQLFVIRKILRIKKPTVEVGDYKLYTDVADEELLAFLDSAASAAEDAYFARYGRLPSGDPYRSAALFAKEADYRSYSAKTGSGTSANTWAGHATRGILAFYAEGRPRVTLARTLVHEIGHLLNARSLGWNLPPWLQEGIATDLGSVWVEDSPDVESDPLAGGEGLAIQGFEARVLYLEGLLKKGRLPALGAVLTFDYETFHRPDLEAYSYAQSAAFIRYLLDGEGGRHAAGFRAFLKQVASGMQANLFKYVVSDIDELDRGFSEWLRAEARTSRERFQNKAEKLWRR